MVYPQPASLIGGADTPCPATRDSCAACDYVPNDSEFQATYRKFSLELESELAGAIADRFVPPSLSPTASLLSLYPSYLVQRYDGAGLYDYFWTPSFCPPPPDESVDDHVYASQTKVKNGEVVFDAFDEAALWVDYNVPGAVLTFGALVLEPGRVDVELEVQSTFAFRAGKARCSGKCEAFCNMGVGVRGYSSEFRCGVGETPDPYINVVSNWFLSRTTADDPKLV